MHRDVVNEIGNTPEQNDMSTPSRMPYAEQKRRGEAIYDAQIRHRIAPADSDKFVLIDVLSGDYEIDGRSAPARIRLRARRPDAVIHTMQNHHSRVIKVRSPRIVARNTKAAR